MGLTCLEYVAVTNTLKVFMRFHGMKPMYSCTGDMNIEVALKEIYLYRCTVRSVVYLTFWRRNYFFFNFSTPCI